MRRSWRRSRLMRGIRRKAEIYLLPIHFYLLPQIPPHPPQAVPLPLEGKVKLPQKLPITIQIHFSARGRAKHSLFLFALFSFSLFLFSVFCFVFLFSFFLFSSPPYSPPSSFLLFSHFPPKRGHSEDIVLFAVDIYWTIIGHCPITETITRKTENYGLSFSYEEKLAAKPTDEVDKSAQRAR